MATTIQSGRASSPLLTADVASRAEVYGGRGLVFDGVSDYLSIEDGGSEGDGFFSTEAGEVSFSVSVWLKIATSGNTFPMAVISQDSVQVCEFSFIINSAVQLNMKNNNSTNPFTIPTVENGKWEHWVVTREYNSAGSHAKAHTFKTYRNAELIQTTLRDADPSGHIADTTIGRGAGSSNFFGGTMSDFKIWKNYTLSLAQVQELYLKPEQSAPSASLSYLSAWYPMSESNPESPQSIVYDHSEKKLGDSDWNGDVITYEADGYQSFSGIILINTLYKVQYTIATRTAPSYAGSLTFAGSSSAFGSVTLADSIGTHTYYFLSLKTDVQLRSTAFRGTITDYSAKPILMGNHATTNFFGSELFDADASTVDSGIHSWANYADASVTNDSGAIKIICNTSNGNGGYLHLSDAKDLSSNLTIGTTYRFTCSAKVDTGSVTLNMSNATGFSSVAVTETSFTTKTIDFIAGHESETFVYAHEGQNETIWLDNFSLKEVGISSTGFTTAQNEPVIPQIPLVKYNEKMVFDGSSGYVQLPAPFSYTKHTISVWFVANPGDNYFFDARDSGTDGIALGTLPNGTIWYGIRGSANNSVTSSSFSFNVLNHVVATYNGSTAKIYLNGIEVGSGTFTDTISTTTNARIGALAYSTSNYFNGVINEVAFYNKEFTQAEAQELFNDGLALDATTHSKSGNLLGYWRNDGVTTWQDRRGWSYLNFDGANDNVENTSFTTHQTNTGTLSGWFIFNDLDGTQRFFGAGGNTVAGTNRTLGFSGPSLYFLGYGADWNTSVGLVVGSLYHLAVTWNGNDIVVYINGTGYSQTLSALVTPTGTKFRIGENAWSSGDDANMKCISASVYTATLSTPEIQSIYNNGHLTSEVGNSNIAHYWKMNHGSTVVDLVGDKNLTVNNATLNTGNNGNVTGSPDSITIREGLTSGKDGLGFPLTDSSSNVIRLNGSSEYVEVPVSKGLQSQSALTLEAWIKCNPFTTAQGIISKDDTTNRVFNLTVLESSSGSANKVIFNIYSGGSGQSVTSTSVVADGNWHHVVGVFEPSVKQAIYIDGKLETKDTSSIPSTIDLSTDEANTPIRIGSFENNALYFKGLIDECKVYNRALTDGGVSVGSMANGEIKKNYKHQKGKHKND